MSDARDDMDDLRDEIGAVPKGDARNQIFRDLSECFAEWSSSITLLDVISALGESWVLLLDVQVGQGRISSEDARGLFDGFLEYYKDAYKRRWPAQ